MKAVVQNGYGSLEHLQLKEVDKPLIEENEVLVNVHATSLNAGDYFSLKGNPWPVRFMVGFPKPKDYILGWDMAGRVEAVGNKVTRFQPGDEVFASCNGTLAEYVTVAEDALAMKPSNLTFEQAAAVPTAALTALHALRNVGKVQPGQKVLVNGASGGVGTFAVQIAKAFGAEVTGVCSTQKVEMVRSIGADHVIDYTKEDFTKGANRYDLILDNVANHAFSELRRVLTPQGMVVPNSGHSGIGYVIKAFLLAPFMRQQETPFITQPNSEDLHDLKELIESGKITPVIDKTYPLSDTQEAFRHLADGHARGKIIVTVKQNT